ncbi:transporter protein Smf2 [Trichophaea hybrida]|nr:transporter protein Smf2 [Trichophaea hybrida]
MNCPSRTDDTGREGWNQNPPSLAADTTTRQDMNGLANSRLRRDDDGCIRRLMSALTKYASFIGPGFLISVAYIDPGNYSTDVAAGTTYRFKLLFIVLLSNLFAIFLQSLCIKLGTVTGMNLAEHIRMHCPGWLNFILYIFAEAAIIATDIAEVIGSAIALNLLFSIPLVAGCAITLVDVLVILLFYRPTGSLRNVRLFEAGVMALVLGVVVCFGIQLSYIRNTTVGEVFRGYLPSSAVVESQGLYMSCGILGATVMPHSLYLGSGIVQSRVRAFDRHQPPTNPSSTDEKYRPSFDAIRHCLNTSILELVLSLFLFALFVNSAILITAGASLSDSAQNTDLFSIHTLLSSTISPVAGTLFALALLLSGTSAGIVCTIAGQMVSEGQLNWSISPWKRRLVTRGIAIVPSIIIAGAVGKEGLGKALNGSQVVLSVILPVLSVPVLWFTAGSKYMTVKLDAREGVVVESDAGEVVEMKNHWFTTVLGVCIWLVIVVMNGALLVMQGMGKG